MRIALVLLAFLSFSKPALSQQVELIASCGASAGHSFFFEGGIIAPGQGGWHKDGVSKGRMLFVRDKEGLDVIFIDALGEPRSHRLEGSTVTAVTWEPHEGSYLFLAYNLAGKSVETFLVQINQHRVGTVVWTTTRAGTVSKKISAFTAPCAPNIK